jgi:dihydroneopterin aldolase
MNLDRIVIKDLEVFCRVGVPDAERARPQRLLLTIELELDFTAAAAGDDLEKTIDYYALSRRLLEFGQGRQWKLIETLAAEAAEMILRDFRPARAGVEVKKFVLPQAAWVAARASRSQAQPSR